MYLLDASALVPLLSDFGKRLLAMAREVKLFTMDLTVYEAGNSLWKLSTLPKSISLEDAAKLMGVLGDLVAKQIIEAMRFAELNLNRTLRTANEHGITFYDSSYILIAKGRAATLVTDDAKLRDVASKYTKTIAYKDFKELMLSKQDEKTIFEL